MKTTRRNSRGLVRYVKAVREQIEDEFDIHWRCLKENQKLLCDIRVMLEEGKQLGEVHDDVADNQQLLWDIKEMLEDAFTAAPMLPELRSGRRAIVALATVRALEQPTPRGGEELEAITAAWNRAPEVGTLLSEASWSGFEQFIALLRTAYAVSARQLVYPGKEKDLPHEDK